MSARTGWRVARLLLAAAVGLAAASPERAASAFVVPMAKRAPIPRRLRRSRPPAAMTNPETRVATAALDDLPLETLPAPPDATGRPASLPEGDGPSDLAIVPLDPKEAIRFQRNHEAMRVHVEVRSTGLGGVYQALSDGNASGGLDVYCADGYGTWPIRWETFRLEEPDVATLEIADGWFDQRGCRASVERRTLLHPRAVAWDGADPVAFASRVEGGFLFFFPGRAVTVAADASAPTPPTVVHGALTRVFLPFERGAASTVLASAPRLSLEASIATARGLELSPAGPVVPDDLVVGVDVVQGVSEESPTAIVRLTSARQDDEAVAAR